MGKTMYYADATMMDGTIKPIAAMSRLKDLEQWVDTFLVASGANVREVVTTKIDHSKAAHHNKILNRLRVSWK